MYVNLPDSRLLCPKNNNYLVVLGETKESKDEILNLCCPLVSDFQKSQKYQKYWNFGRNGKYWVLC